MKTDDQPDLVIRRKDNTSGTYIISSGAGCKTVGTASAKSKLYGYFAPKWLRWKASVTIAITPPTPMFDINANKIQAYVCGDNRLQCEIENEVKKSLFTYVRKIQGFRFSLLVYDASHTVIARVRARNWNREYVINTADRDGGIVIKKSWSGDWQTILARKCEYMLSLHNDHDATECAIAVGTALAIDYMFRD